MSPNVSQCLQPVSAFSPSPIHSKTKEANYKKAAELGYPPAMVRWGDFTDNEAMVEAAANMGNAEAQVSGWGVCCHDFRRRPIASCCFQCLLPVCRRSKHT